MIDILLGYWQKKIKLVDSRGLFKGICLIGMLLAAGLTAFCEIAFLHSDQYLLFLIINLFLIIYNKPTILNSIQRLRNVGFFINRDVLKRYIFFEVLKENALIVVWGAANIITVCYAMVTGKGIIVIALLLIPVNYYLLEVYQSYQKILLLLLLGGLAIGAVYQNLIVLSAVIGADIVYLYRTFHRCLLQSIYADRYQSAFSKSGKISVCKADMLYFLRMPLDKVIEMLYTILLFGVVMYYLKIEMVYYLVVVLFLVEIEILQEEKMKEFEIFYNQRNFLEISSLSGSKKYFLSQEFNHALKYIFILFWIYIIQSVMHGCGIQEFIMSINFLILLIGISYRYYAATNLSLKYRTDIKQSWFRLAMLYIILFSLAPFIFAEVLEALEGYRRIYGYLFAMVMDIVLFAVKVEKLTGAANYECKQENTE